MHRNLALSGGKIQITDTDHCRFGSQLYTIAMRYSTYFFIALILFTSCETIYVRGKDETYPNLSRNEWYRIISDYHLKLSKDTIRIKTLVKIDRIQNDTIQAVNVDGKLYTFPLQDVIRIDKANEPLPREKVGMVVVSGILIGLLVVLVIGLVQLYS